MPPPDTSQERYCGYWTTLFCKSLRRQLYPAIYPIMPTGSSQKRAVQAYRSRLAKRGIARFEVSGNASDRTLIRKLAKCLTEDSMAAAQLRATLRSELGAQGPDRGGILAALRSSPLVGTDVISPRPKTRGRKVDL